MMLLLSLLLGGCQSASVDTASPAVSEATTLSEGVPTDLNLQVSFDADDRPTLATVTARVPAGMQPDQAEVVYQIEPFGYGVALDLEQTLSGELLTWNHPFPAEASVALELTLSQGSDRRSQTVTVRVPQASQANFPPFVSDWTYEDWPRPMTVTASVTVLEPGGAREDYIVLLDQAGRYIWSEPMSSPRAFAEPDGVLTLPGIEDRSEAAPVPLERVCWDGSIVQMPLEVTDFHHDFALSDSKDALYALTYEELPSLERDCGRIQVLGDVIQEVSLDKTTDLWRTSEDYPRAFLRCDNLTDKSVSYLNGVSYHDGVLAASSSPLSKEGDPAIITGFQESDSQWRFLFIAESPESSDVPLEHLPACLSNDADQSVLLKPHNVICEANSASETDRKLSCFVHDRRIIGLCDTLEWIEITDGPEGVTATCLASTYPDHPVTSDSCGDAAHHGNFDILDGRVDDPDGMFGAEFSPVGGYVTGVRARRDGEAAMERVFRMFDPNTERRQQDPRDGAACIDTAQPCVTNGTFLTVSTGLGDRWFPLDDAGR